MKDGGRSSGNAGTRRDDTTRAITVARVIFVSLVGYGGYLLVQSFEPPAPWLVWAPLGILGGVIAGAFARIDCAECKAASSCGIPIGGVSSPDILVRRGNSAASRGPIPWGRQPPGSRCRLGSTRLTACFSPCTTGIESC